MTNALNTLLAKLDSLGVERSLTEETYRKISERGFRGNSGVLAAVICDIVLEDHPMTLRGLFYRVVSTGLIDSTSNQNYKKIGRLVTSLRREGLLRYEWIVDSLRATLKPSSWTGLADFADTVREAYRKDFWNELPSYVHIFCEKDAIAGVLQPSTEKYDVRLSPARGYCSESFAYEIASTWKRIKKPIFAAYFGDYDPSGFDIERNLRTKLADMSGRDFEWIRLGVNQDDFDEFNLVRLKPKKSDCRYKKFFEQHGKDCAEVDAIPPSELRDRVEKFILNHIPEREWLRLQEVEALERESFQRTLGTLSV